MAAGGVYRGFPNRVAYPGAPLSGLLTDIPQLTGGFQKVGQMCQLNA